MIDIIPYKCVWLFANSAEYGVVCGPIHGELRLWKMAAMPSDIA